MIHCIIGAQPAQGIEFLLNFVHEIYPGPVDCVLVSIIIHLIL